MWISTSLFESSSWRSSIASGCQTFPTYLGLINSDSFILSQNKTEQEANEDIQK